MTDTITRIQAAKSRSRMMHGGYTDVPPLAADEAAWINAIIDTLIPPEDGWPGAKELRVTALLVDYLVPAGAPVDLYPHFGRDEFCALARRIMGDLVSSPLEQRVAALRSVEEGEPELFARLRDFVYYVYYGHSNVVALIRERTKYGADYLGGGQPEGYLDVLEGWGDRRLTDRGVFIPTVSVLRVPQAAKELS